MPDRFQLFEPDEPRVAVIIGTGPSLTQEQLDRVSHLRKFGVNNACEFGLDVHLADKNWWHVNGADHPGHKWTWDEVTADIYGINYIRGRWAPGLSADPAYIHYHHGSGPQTVNLALHYGVKTMILIGWDMRYPGKISDREYTGKRHYHDETEITSKHWPKTGPRGEWTGLIAEMKTITPEDYGIEILNCTPGSAMTHFPMIDLDEALARYA